MEIKVTLAIDTVRDFREISTALLYRLWGEEKPQDTTALNGLIVGHIIRTDEKVRPGKWRNCGDADCKNENGKCPCRKREGALKCMTIL